MTSISNIKIGKKDRSRARGNCLRFGRLICRCPCGEPAPTNKRGRPCRQRLTKARLAERIAGDTSAIAHELGRMIIAEKSDRRTARTKLLSARRAAPRHWNEFKALADTPTSIKHGADMAELVQSAGSRRQKAVEQLQAGKIADAAKSFKGYAAGADKIRAKAAEAAQFQDNKVVEIEKTNKDTASTIWISLIAGSLFAIAFAIFGAIVLTRGIAAPLTRAVAHLGRIAEGDLSEDAPAEFQVRGDEIGTLARAKQTMIVALRKMIQEISSGIQVLSSSSTELMTSSTDMTSGSRHASDKAHSVSAAAEEMSSNITSVAAGMEQTHHEPDPCRLRHRADDCHHRRDRAKFRKSAPHHG